MENNNDKDSMDDHNDKSFGSLESFLLKHFGISSKKSQAFKEMDSKGYLTKNNMMMYFHHILKEKITLLISSNLDKLMWILYRIDVKEADCARAFEKGDINEIASDLAHLIIDREIKKNKF